MMQSLIFCLLVAISGRSLGAPVDGAHGDCPGGLENGDLLERGRFFYECRDGNIVPKGCLTDDLKHVEIGATFDKKTHRLQCTKSNDDLLSWEPILCLFNGAEHKIDEQWEDGTNFYTCKKTESNELRIDNLGCVDQGKRVPLNEKVTKEDFAYICNSTVNNGARLMPSACVKDSREYNPGDSFDVDKFWYNCVRTGSEKLSVKAAGCLNNGKRLNDGDRYHENDVIYECTIDAKKNDVRATGCVQTSDGATVERRLGCTWVEGQEPFQYEWACQHDTTTNSVKKVQVRCNYKVGGGVYNIDPGCYRVVDKAAFGCLKDGSSLKLQSFQGDSAEQSATGAGLHAC